jgi:hypothetical protein
MNKNSIIDEINRGSATIYESLEAGVDSLLAGNRSSAKNAATKDGGPECQPTVIYNNLNQITGNGLLTAQESTVFLVLSNPVLTGGPGTPPAPLAIAQGSSILLQPVVVPAGFYLKLTGLTMRVDEEPNTVDVAASITTAGLNEAASDLWLPTAATGSPNPRGMVFAGSNVGFLVATGPVTAPQIPGGFQLNFQFFRNALAVNTCNVQAVIMGVLLLDKNYENFRTAV